MKTASRAWLCTAWQVRGVSADQFPIIPGNSMDDMKADSIGVSDAVSPPHTLNSRPPKVSAPDVETDQTGRLGKAHSAHKIVNDSPMDIGQPEISATVSIREAFVIHSQQVQHRRMQIMQVYLVLDGLGPEFIRQTVP